MAEHLELPRPCRLLRTVVWNLTESVGLPGVGYIAGQELAGVLRLLAGWGARQGEEPAAPRHSVCGTPMEARWWCPTCERPVADDDGDELHFA